MGHALTAAARAAAGTAARNVVGSLKEMGLLGKVQRHALIGVPLRHIFRGLRRIALMATVRICDRGRTHKHESQ